MNKLQKIKIGYHIPVKKSLFKTSIELGKVRQAYIILKTIDVIENFISF
jgi:hypothetical protein